MDKKINSDPERLMLLDSKGLPRFLVSGYNSSILERFLVGTVTLNRLS
jgi:hypothetical protein